jgi:predicted Ser/Thr protein kinase/cbb3-type cytochrome oxidase subunit 3
MAFSSILFAFVILIAGLSFTNTQRVAPYGPLMATLTIITVWTSILIPFKTIPAATPTPSSTQAPVSPPTTPVPVPVSPPMLPTVPISPTPIAIPTEMSSSVPSQSPHSPVIQSPAFHQNYPSPATPSPSSLTLGITFGVIGGVLILFALGIVVFILWRRKRKQRQNKKKPQNIDNNSTNQSNKQTVTIESDMKAFTSLESNTTMTTTIQSTYQPGTETLKRLTPGQIPLNELEIEKEIGEGTYGRVCVGKWKKYRVALKFCQNRGKLDEFMREANLMISLPPHPNVVRMYGVSIDGTQPIIVMEYCAGGSLDKLLFDENQPISNEQKIVWVYEIAMGMRHLHKHNIVHRDLAARNILLSHSNPHLHPQPKISDFGMSRVLLQEFEGKTKSGVGPVCWMAPESIGQQVYSKKSDVWMFGIVVYEIVARCEPHADKDPSKIYPQIRDNFLTPEIPNHSPQKLRQLMQMCWNKQPAQRPDFEMICTMLEQQ